MPVAQSTPNDDSDECPQVLTAESYAMISLAHGEKSGIFAGIDCGCQRSHSFVFLEHLESGLDATSC
jgi:hypothetical protein